MEKIISKLEAQFRSLKAAAAANDRSEFHTCLTDLEELVKDLSFDFEIDQIEEG